MAFSEQFELDQSARWIFLAAPWVMTAFAIFSAILPMIPSGGRPRNESFLLGLSIVGFVVFSLGACYFRRVVRRLPEAAISVDEDGMWPTIRDKNVALVKWDSVARLREREIMQRLEALDSSGRVIARLEYQLQDFQRLRGIVLQRTKLIQSAVSASGVYQKSKWHHVFSLGTIICFAALGWYVGQIRPLIGYLGMAILIVGIAWDYWMTPFRLRVTCSALEVHMPCRRQYVPRQRISHIEIDDELINHAKHPVVTMYLVDGSKPIQLKALGLQAVELYQILQTWRKNDA